MKNKTLTILLTFASFFLFSQEKISIVGDWYTEDKQAIVTIYQEGNSFSGKTTWMKNPLDANGNPKLDKLNPDKSLRLRARLGLQIMQGFVYKGESKWEDGRIYKPTNGKTYGGTATLVDENTLELKGHVISLPFLSKKSKWSRKID